VGILIFLSKQKLIQVLLLLQITTVKDGVQHQLKDQFAFS
jgi:hypothetical protein